MLINCRCHMLHISMLEASLLTRTSLNIWNNIKILLSSLNGKNWLRCYWLKKYFPEDFHGLREQHYIVNVKWDYKKLLSCTTVFQRFVSASIWQTYPMYFIRLMGTSIFWNRCWPFNLSTSHLLVWSNYTLCPIETVKGDIWV